MSLAELVFYLTRDRNDFIAIPVFPSRVFRHSFLFCNAAAAIDGPESLSGRKIAFQRWVQTAGVWMRGMLVDEYGVSPTQTEWYVSSLHHWREEDGAVAPRDGSSIRWLGKGDEPQETEDAYRAVLEGRVDVMGVTEGQIAHLEQDSRVRR
ncbi:MAG TPA: hypothetical protein VK821_08995, partial [Dehalococcoidia bacterium]|nr:hypothetical protein [Dehalococcoidia bacterium]